MSNVEIRPHGHDGWNLIREERRPDAKNRTMNYAYTWGLDLSGTAQGAGGIGGLLAASYGHTSAVASVFYTFDGNGNVSDLIADNGTQAAHYEYDPFGNTLVATGPLARENTFRFSTKYTDDETGHLYYGYRFYQPETGRWLSRDPIGHRDGPHLYAFVRNLPIDRIDLMGLWKLGVHKQITADAFERVAFTCCLTEDQKKDLLDGLKEGSVEPDIPGGLQVAAAMFVDEAVLPNWLFVWIWGGTVTYQSHFGNKQWWHAMQSAETTADQIKTKIVDLTLDRATQYNATDDYEAKGKIFGFSLHILQDSYCRSHAARDAGFAITRFQNYGVQDSGKHGVPDTQITSPQYQKAVDAIVQVMNYVLCDFKKLELQTYLQNEVLKLTPTAIAGGTEDEFEP